MGNSDRIKLFLLITITYHLSLRLCPTSSSDTPTRAPDTFPSVGYASRLAVPRATTFASPTRFASRVHAEVRREGDHTFCKTSRANGTFYRRLPRRGAIPLTIAAAFKSARPRYSSTTKRLREPDGATIVRIRAGALTCFHHCARIVGAAHHFRLLESIEERARTLQCVLPPSASLQQSSLLALISKGRCDAAGIGTLDER